MYIAYVIAKQEMSLANKFISEILALAEGKALLSSTHTKVSEDANK